MFSLYFIIFQSPYFSKQDTLYMCASNTQFQKKEAIDL